MAECVYISYWHGVAMSALGLKPRAYMATKCQYDLEAHLCHIITFLLHPRKFN